MRKSVLSTPYHQKLLRLNSNFVGLWPLSETAGTVVYDLASNNYSAVSSGLDRSNWCRGFRAPDGGTCARFDGSASYIDLVAAAPSSAKTEGSMGIWAAIDESVLSGTTKAMLWHFAADGNNFIDASVDTTAQRLSFEYEGNTTNSAITKLMYNDPYAKQFPLWHHYGVRYSATNIEFDLWVDGVKEPTISTMGAWVGSFAAAQMVLGVSNTTPADQFSGWLSNFVWYSSVLTDDEMVELSKVP
jgi:hypothetical protein